MTFFKRSTVDEKEIEKILRESFARVGEIPNGPLYWSTVYRRLLDMDIHMDINVDTVTKICGILGKIWDFHQPWFKIGLNIKMEIEVIKKINEVDPIFCICGKK